MSHHSGFSSASRVEIDRLNKESEEKDRRAELAATEMAAQRAQLTAQNEQMKALHAILAANGLIPVQNIPVQNKAQCTSAQARAFDQAQAQAQARPHAREPDHHRPGTSHSQPHPKNLTVTPARKRHLSDQPERVAKITGAVGKNRFEILTQAESYPDRTMRPGSVTSDKARPAPTYASKVGRSRANKTSGLAAAGKATENPEVRRDQANGSEENLEIEGIFSITNEGAMRKEIEVHFLTINGEKFSGTVTRQEAKHIVFKECLGFGDFSNFGGARVGYKGSPTVTFLLNSAINVDEFYPMQRFEFHRKSSINGRSHTDIIGCKIVGLRQINRERPQPDINQSTDDGTRKITIEGCEYRIPKEVLFQYLEHYGEIVSDIREQLFDDGGEEGLNRTGNYTVRIRLEKDIPQLIPIHGKRIKINYPGVSRLCTKCFGKHQKNVCQSRKLSWPEYINKFMSTNPEIGVDLIERPRSVKNLAPVRLSPEEEIARANSPVGERFDSEMFDDTQNDDSMDSTYANEITQPITTSAGAATDPAAVTSKPLKADFLVPKNKVEHNAMRDKLVKAGTRPHEAEQIIALRKTAFSKANLEFKKSNSKETNQTKRRSNVQSKLASVKNDNNGH